MAMKNLISSLAAAASAAAVLTAAPLAFAHHSAAMFDTDKEVTVQGTVKEFQFTNPHSWLLVEVADAGGKVTVWSFETRNPSTLLRSGIKKSSLVFGDKVTVKAHPLRDGRPGAELIAVTKADGSVLTPL